MATSWQFWIDVGGTFTDCFAVAPNGDLHRHKLLSSGVTKGSVGRGSSQQRILDPTRRGNPVDFWKGFRVRLLDSAGQTVAESTIVQFDRAVGALRVDPPFTTRPEAGQVYELVTDQEAPIQAIRFLLELPADQPIPPVTVRLGTTRGTNALITRTGARTALITTKGFGDILRIGYQNRPRLFELSIKKPSPLFVDVVEIDERMTCEGEVLIAPDPQRVSKQLAELKQRGIESLAICMLNAYIHPKHEQLIGEIARKVGFKEVSLSSAVAPLIKIVSRGDTTVVDAYLNPILRTYVQRLRDDLGGDSDLRLLTSAGGLVSAERFVGKDSILSGPAGGVVGFSKVAQAAGFSRAIGFDMGGTSTDVSRYDGRYELEYETEKAGVRVVAPMMAIETVAAGGGSVCGFDGVKLVVGPASAGADPGPACYGQGGPLAMTDINLFLGKILPGYFPFQLDEQVVRQRLQDLCDEIDRLSGSCYEPIELADGFLRVANANMAKAIRSISIAKGYDPSDYVLVAFGGAAPQHACAVATELGITRILNHPDAGILSAYGIGLADVVRHRVVGLYQPYSEAAVRSLETEFARMTDETKREVLAEGVEESKIDVVRSLDLRYQGLDAFLTIHCSETSTYAEQYEAEHRRLYGYVHQNRPLEIVAARLQVTGRSATQVETSRQDSARAPAPAPTPTSSATVCFDARPLSPQVFARTHLTSGHVIEGPAIVTEANSTTVIEPGWRAVVLTGGELLIQTVECGDLSPLSDSCLQRKKESDHKSPQANEPDPIQLELFNNQFAGIAEQMGITLRNTSSSVNVKERLDFSCALFTPTGDLVVNAPHIPVHLGAMSQSVKAIIRDNPDVERGDVFVTNDPYNGGSHLPDVTVVTPVHELSGRLLFFTASRAHHAELGGITPGSMPPFSRNLAEEGILICNFKVISAGHSNVDDLRDLLLAGPHPSRSVNDNLADIAAQIAANEQGSRDLLALCNDRTPFVVEAYMEHIQRAAEQKMRSALSKVPDGEHRFVDHLDDGSPIAVTINVNADEAIVDFSGTGPVVEGNLNANRAIVSAAVMYCLRCLIDEDIPLNQGVLAPIQIVLPECLLNPPRGRSPEECPAVVGGNVETSQRVVDVVLGALGLAAASQGTMNNLTFGDDSFGYYETICGGAGATPLADGADAVHTHMTNTRLTDPEVIELRFPVRVREFSIRRGSGGGGKHRGGDGVVRRIEFLRDLDVSILSQRRGAYSPFGLAGGEPGDPGKNTITHRNGQTEQLPGRVHFQANVGDVLTIETPGGGGWGV